MKSDAVIEHIREYLLPCIKQERSALGLPTDSTVWLLVTTAISDDVINSVITEFKRGETAEQLADNGVATTSHYDVFTRN